MGPIFPKNRVENNKFPEHGKGDQYYVQKKGNTKRQFTHVNVLFSFVFHFHSVHLL